MTLRGKTVEAKASFCTRLIPAISCETALTISCGCSETVVNLDSSVELTLIDETSVVGTSVAELTSIIFRLI